MLEQAVKVANAHPDPAHKGILRLRAIDRDARHAFEARGFECVDADAHFLDADIPMRLNAGNTDAWRR